MPEKARNQKLINERKRRLWTQPTAAKKAGISLSSLKNAEQGQTPGRFVAGKLMELYGLEYDDLFYLPRVQGADRTTRGVEREVTNAS